jgi:UDP-N-acetylglucosamine:LPS N-acetylglucosamine transferase
MRKLTIVFFDAGGGHRNAAEAIKNLLESQGRRWDVRLLNLQEHLDALDVVRRTTGIRIQDGYNLILRKGWTRPTPQLLVMMRGLIRLYHSRVVASLKKHWQQHPADVVLSVIPLFNRAMAESIREAIPEAAFATLLTDLADNPPHFWIEPESEFLICGTERAERQALAMGHGRHRVFRTSGMILKPKFYEKRAPNVAAERLRLGLDPSLPTGIVLFGGHGSATMLNIAQSLNQRAEKETVRKVQLIMICGHNEELRNELTSMPTRMPMRVEGFTSDVAHFMSLADFFIGKPGPGSISEAMQFHLPVIVERNAKTMPQERYNTDWVTEKQLGIVLGSFSDIENGVDRLLEPKTFLALRANAKAQKNRALFEVPMILEEVLERHIPYSVPVPPEFTNLQPVGQNPAWSVSSLRS